MEDLQIDQYCYGVEFGFDTAQTIWPSFILKRALGDRIRIRSIGKHRFPESLWRQFTDEYAVDDAPCPVEHKRTRPALRVLAQCFRKGVVDRDDLMQKMNWPPVEGPGERYVCFIPTLAERRGPVGGPYDDAAGGHSLPFSDWLRLKTIVNDHGYEVIAMGDLKNTGLRKVDWRKIGDRCFFIQTADKSRYLYEQLRIIRHARFTLGMGGGCVVAPVFGFPAICVDANWYDRFPGAHASRRDDEAWAHAMSDHYLFPLWSNLANRDDIDVLWDFDSETGIEQKLESTARWVERRIIERLAGP